MLSKRCKDRKMQFQHLMDRCFETAVLFACLFADPSLFCAIGPLMNCLCVVESWLASLFWGYKTEQKRENIFSCRRRFFLDR